MTQGGEGSQCIVSHQTNYHMDNWSLIPLGCSEQDVQAQPYCYPTRGEKELGYLQTSSYQSLKDGCFWLVREDIGLKPLPAHAVREPTNKVLRQKTSVVFCKRHWFEYKGVPRTQKILLGCWLQIPTTE